MEKNIFCLHCGNKLKRGQYKFCCKKCSAIYNNKNRKHSQKTKEKIKNSLKKFNEFKTINKTINVLKIKPVNDKEINYCLFCQNIINKNKKFCSCFCAAKYKHIESYQYFLKYPEKFNNGNYTPKQFKDFFLKEQNNKCDICKCDNIWNNKILVFVLDHINGDASDNRRNNIRLICPNCDSQLDTFKSKNKNSKRRNYFREKIRKTMEKEFASSKTSLENYVIM